MPLGAAYGSIPDYKQGRVEKSDDDNRIGDQLLAFSREIEIDLRQYFNRSATVITRYYTGAGRCYLDLDREGDGCPGIASTSGLIVKVDEDGDGSFADETAWTINSDFELHDLNAANYPEARPWHRLYIPEWSTKGVFPEGRRVAVTAIFGWPAVPRLIRELLFETVAIWRKETASATDRIQELDQVVASSPYAKGMLNRARAEYRLVQLR